jgi:hypothetical protein
MALVGFQGDGLFWLLRKLDFSAQSGLSEAVTLKAGKSV